MVKNINNTVAAQRGHVVKEKKSETGEKEPFVSVLTPVYNGEKYLEECIQSVLNQNYHHWEYVIVDNQSTDESRQIINKYAQKDKRIRIHNNEEFLPQMENLNHAFRQISPDSKYCKVVHADDVIFEDCLKEMVSLAEKYPSIGIVNSYWRDGEKAKFIGLPYSNDYYEGGEFGRKFLKSGMNFFGSPSNLLLRSSLIRKREKVYDESYLESDVTACLDMLRESDFGFVHQVLTYIRRHNDSVTSTKEKKDHPYLFGFLKMHLDYAHFFFSEDELEQRTQQKIKAFYIQNIRLILSNRNLDAYRRFKKELDLLNLPLNRINLAKQVFKEMVKLPIIHFMEKKGFTQGGKK